MAEKVRRFDWSTTPLGPVSSWPAELKSAAAFVLENAFPAALVWRQGLVTIYNDGFRPILGDKPEALGRSFADIWAEVWHEIGPIVERAFAGESMFIEDFPLVVLRSDLPEQAHFTFSYSPVRSADGSVIGMIDTVFETTKDARDRRALAEAHAALRESEERLRLALDAAAMGSFIWYPEEDRCEPDARLLDFYGQPPDGLISLDRGLRLLHPDDRQRYVDAVARATDPAGDGRLREDVRVCLPNKSVRWLAITAQTQFDGTRPVRMAGTAFDITARKQAEERQAFLLKLTDALRPLADPAEIQATAVRLVGEHLGADSAFYYDIDAEGWATTSHGFSADGITMPKRFRVSDFGRQWLDAYAKNRTLAVADIATDERFSEQERQVWRAVGLSGGVSVPLNKGGRLRAVLGVNNAEPRQWTDGELHILEEVAERSWAAVERARTEAALRSSEQRLRLIVENARDYAIFTVDPGGVVTGWREGAEAVFGYSRDEAVGRDADILFTAEDREKGEPEKERVVARDIGKAPSVRWHVRKDGRRVFIEGLVTALRDADGRLTGYLKIGQDVTERRAADERQRLLVAELQHRVRNIMAMIRSIARRTVNSSETVEDYARHLEGRLDAMARTQALLTRNPGLGVHLQDIILEELEAQAVEPSQYGCDGPDVSISPKAAEVLTLALHELATNATKYGAFAALEGRVDVKWAIEPRDGEQWLRLAWTESGVRPEGGPVRDGFGSELVRRRVPYELRGEGRMELTPTGLQAEIKFPLEDGESILQTDPGRNGRSP